MNETERITELEQERDAALASQAALRDAVQALRWQWAQDMTGYPDTELGRMATATVRVCDRELGAVLAALPPATAHPPAYLAVDLWMALHLPVEAFDGYYERNGWADTWAALLSQVHGPARCGRPVDGEVCVLAPHSPDSPCYGASDVGTSEPLPPATDGPAEATIRAHERERIVRELEPFDRDAAMAVRYGVLKGGPLTADDLRRGREIAAALADGPILEIASPEPTGADESGEVLSGRYDMQPIHIEPSINGEVVLTVEGQSAYPHALDLLEAVQRVVDEMRNDGLLPPAAPTGADDDVLGALYLSHWAEWSRLVKDKATEKSIARAWGLLNGVLDAEKALAAAPAAPTADDETLREQIFQTLKLHRPSGTRSDDHPWRDQCGQCGAWFYLLENHQADVVLAVLAARGGAR